MDVKEYMANLQATHDEAFVNLVRLMAQGNTIVRLVAHMDAPQEQRERMIEELAELFSEFTLAALPPGVDHMEVIGHCLTVVRLAEEKAIALHELAEMPPAGHA